MNLKPIASNMTEVQIGNKVVLFSYQTPVAYLEKGDAILKDRMFVTTKYWSNTTSRHITKWVNSLGFQCTAQDILQESLDNLLSEVK